MVIGVKNHGQRNLRRRATKFTPTGNKIYANGQQNLRQRATEITPTGNENYANPFVFRKRRAYRFSFSSISFFFFCMRIYIRLPKKKINI